MEAQAAREVFWLPLLEEKDQVFKYLPCFERTPSLQALQHLAGGRPGGEKRPGVGTAGGGGGGQAAGEAGRPRAHSGGGALGAGRRSGAQLLPGEF